MVHINTTSIGSHIGYLLIRKTNRLTRIRIIFNFIHIRCRSATNFKFVYSLHPIRYNTVMNFQSPINIPQILYNLFEIFYYILQYLLEILILSAIYLEIC